MQQPHIDHPEPQPPGPVDAVAINIPVVDVTEDNGATMYWPGSHLAGEMLSSRNPTEEQTASWPRGAARTVCERGTILVRDLRVWHRGMPNLTSTHRPMITLVVKRHLNAPGDSNQRLGFEADASTEEFWLHPRLQTAAWLFEGPIDYFHLDGHSKPANRPDASLARKLHPEMPGSTQTRGRL
jgi:ectoine hydroxylase-related dioxygenase (phytanoyl-CoA dioxygenase family)